MKATHCYFSSELKTIAFLKKEGWMLEVLILEIEIPIDFWSSFIHCTRRSFSALVFLPFIQQRENQVFEALGTNGDGKCQRIVQWSA